MNLPFLVAGLLLGNCFSPLRDAMVRFLIMEIRILQRTLADQGVDRIICTPEERFALLAIGSEMNHKVKDIFLINAWQTYTRWLREEREGKVPGRPGRPRKFSDEITALIVRIAKENIMAGLGKIVGEMKKLGIAISTGTIKAILRRHNITPPNDRQY